MILQHLDISNFRCLKEYSIDFYSGFNILIGRNGSGKSTLVHAVQKALSFIFSSDRSVGDTFLSAGINNLNIRSFEAKDFHFDDEDRTSSLFAEIRGLGLFAGRDLDWTLYKRNAANASLYPSKYKVAFNKVMTGISTGADYPLLAYYSDSYPHRNVKLMSQAVDIIKKDRLPRNFGYYQWDDESSCTSIWEKRLSDRLARMLPIYAPLMRLESERKAIVDSPNDDGKQERLEEVTNKIAELNAQFDPLYDETNFIEEKLKKFISRLPKVDGENYGISYLSVASDENGYYLLINFENGKSSAMTDLPAGYRRLLSIVLDLAYRSYILNERKEPRGVVIIDEIDLHLHPSLEGSVVEAFRSSFPQLQFIVTTHSVAVISNLSTAEECPDNRIFVLADGAGRPEVLQNLNGMDYDIVLRDFMDAFSRNEDIKKLMDECLTFHSYGMKEEADTIYKRIVEKTGSESSVIRELDEKIANYNDAER